MFRFFLLGFVGVWLPGPDMLLILRISIERNYKDSLLSLLGILTGNVIYLFPIIGGFYFLFESWIPWIMFMGGFYMLYSGIQSYQSHFIIPSYKKFLYSKAKHLYLTGLFTNLSNPKAMLYFASVLAPALKQKEEIFSAILLFFLGVILAFLSIMILSGHIKNLLNGKMLLWIKNIISMIFCLYGIGLWWESLKIFHLL